MKRAFQILGLALAVLMILPMLAALPVKVSAEETPPTYDTAHDGQLLRSVNFKAEEWSTDYASSSNSGADVAVSDDGSSVKFTVTTSSSSRAMWGGFYSGEPDDSPADLAYEEALGTVLPMKAGVKYTMVFDLQLGADGVAFGIQVDGHNALSISGNGQSRWYSWNDYGQAADKPGVGDTSVNNEKWHYHTASGASKRDKNTYAVVLDYDAKTMDLYVVDVDDGAFYFCRSIYYSDANVWDSSYFRCRLTARKVSGTVNSSYTVDVSNLNIYKGNAMTAAPGGGYRLPYWSHSDGDELLTMDFDSDTIWNPGFVITGEQADNNDDLDIAITDEGSTVTFTSINANNKRGIWGGTLPADFFPLSAGTKYTVYYALEMEAGMRCAFYPDGIQGIAIYQNGTTTKYQSWSSPSGDGANWANKTDYGSGLKKFAVELDYDAGKLTLYGMNRNGLYVYINQATGLTFESDVLYCAFWAGNTAGKTVTVSDVSIEKGLTVPVLSETEFGLASYEAAADNALLETVNFKQAGYNPGFADANNLGADVEISNDGTAVSFTVHSNHNKRAMWGDYVVDPLPLYSGGYNSENGVKYTFVYDVTFGNENVAFGLQVDGNNALLIHGNGDTRWFEWNSQKVGTSAKGAENWINRTDVPADEKQTFAVTMDYNAHTFELYVMRSNGSFAFVRSLTYNDCDWSGSRARARFYIRTVDTEQTPDETYTATVANLKIYKGLHLPDRYVLQTVTGAAVRLNTPTGLRFTGLVGKGLLDDLKAEYGEGNVKIGMLITPTDYLSANSLAFTKEALDGCGALPAGKKYVRIEATTVLESDDGNAYQINCVLSNVREANYTRKFSAITYVEINGSTYLYAGYSEENNARSITLVAEAALLDLSDTQTGEYQYAVDGKYSPYTEAQRATLAGFRGAGFFTVMSYNVEVYDDDDGWDGRDPEKAIETVLDVDPDILGLQEVNQVVEKNLLGITTRDDGWDDYLPTLTEHGYTRLTGEYTGAYNFEKNEIFYKTAKFTKLAEGTKTFKQTAIDLSVPNDENADQSLDGSERIFHYAVLQETATGKKILVVSAHLHYGGTGAGHEEDDKVRRYEIRTLLAWLETQRATYPNQIVMGDMNAHYLSGTGKTAMDIYRDGGFSITHDTALIKGDVGGTLANSGRTTRPEWVFDYVMTRGNFETVYYTAVDNRIDNGNSTYPSDHIPVMATMILN